MTKLDPSSVGLFDDFTRGQGLRGQLLRAGAGSILVKIAATALGLAVTVLLARSLGANGYGIYTYVFALTSLLAIPAQFGLPSLVVRETAKAQAKEQWGLMRGLWRWTNRTAGVISILLVILAGGAGWIWRDHFSHLQIMTFTTALLLVPVIALGNLRGAALRGLRKVVIGQLPEHVLRPGFLICLTIGALLVLPQEKFTAATAMLLHVVSASLAFIVGAWLLFHFRPRELRAQPIPIYEARAWSLSTLPLGMIAAMQLVNDYTDILMLGLFLNAEQVGIYKISVQMAVLVSFPITAVNLAIAPHISRLHAAGDFQRLQRLLTTSAIGVFFSAGATVGALCLFGNHLIEFVFGPAFRDSYAPMIVLAAGQLVVATLGSLVTIANMTGHEHAAAKTIGIGAIVNIGLNAFLIPAYGIMGAAVATVSSLLVWRLLLFSRLKTSLGVNPSVIGVVRHQST